MMQVEESTLDNGQKGSSNELGNGEKQTEEQSAGDKHYLFDLTLPHRNPDESCNANPRHSTRGCEGTPEHGLRILSNLSYKATSPLGDLNANSIAIRGGAGRVDMYVGEKWEAHPQELSACLTNQVEGGVAVVGSNGKDYEGAGVTASGCQADESILVFGGQCGLLEEEQAGAQPGCNSTCVNSRGCYMDEEFSTYVTASVDYDPCPSQVLSCKGESEALDNQWHVDFDELPVDNDEQSTDERLEPGHASDVSTTGPNITVAVDNATWSTDILNDSQEISAATETGRRCKQSHLVSDSDPVSSDCMDTTEAPSVSQCSFRQMRATGVFCQEYLAQSVGGSGSQSLVAQRHGQWQISSDECDEGFSSINHSHGRDGLDSSIEPEKYELGILCKSKVDYCEAKSSRAEDFLMSKPEDVLNASSFLVHKSKAVSDKLLTETTTSNPPSKPVGVVANEGIAQAVMGQERRANHAVDNLYEVKSEAAFVPDWATLDSESMERLNKTKNSSSVFTVQSDNKVMPENDSNIDMPSFDCERLATTEYFNPVDQSIDSKKENVVSCSDNENRSPENTTLDTYDSSDVFLAKDYLCDSSRDCVDTSVSEISSSLEFERSTAEPIKSSRQAELDAQQMDGTCNSGLLTGETRSVAGSHIAEIQFPKLKLKMPPTKNAPSDLGGPPALVQCEDHMQSKTQIENQLVVVTDDLNTGSSLETYDGILTRQGFLDIMSFDSNVFSSLRMETPMDDTITSDSVFLTEVELEVALENGEIQTEKSNMIQEDLDKDKVDNKTSSLMKKTTKRSMARLIPQPNLKNMKSKVDTQAAHSPRPLKRSVSVTESKMTDSPLSANSSRSSASLKSSSPRSPSKLNSTNSKPPRPTAVVLPATLRGGADRPATAPMVGTSHGREVRTLSFVSRIPGLRRASSRVRLSASISVKTDSSLAEQMSEASYNSTETPSETSRSAENSKKSLASSSSAADRPMRPALAVRPAPGPHAGPGVACQASRTHAQARARLSPPGFRLKRSEFSMTSRLGGTVMGSSSPPEAGQSKTLAQPRSAVGTGRPPRATPNSLLPAATKSTSARDLPTPTLTARATPAISRPSSAPSPAQAARRQSGPSLRPLRSSVVGSRPQPATSATRPRSTSSSSVGSNQSCPSNQSSVSRISNASIHPARRVWDIRARITMPQFVGSTSLHSVVSRHSASPGRTPARTPTGTAPRPALGTQARANAIAATARGDSANGDIKQPAVLTPRRSVGSVSHYAPPGRQRRATETGKERGVARSSRVAKLVAGDAEDASPAGGGPAERALAESEQRAAVLVERCARQAQQLERQLEGSAGNLRALDALAVALQHTHAKHAEAVRKDRELSLVIHNVQEELTSSTARCEALQHEKEEIHDKWRQEAERAEEEHVLALSSLRDSLSLQHEAERDALRREHLAELAELQKQHQEQLDELQLNQESIAQEIENRHIKEIYSLKEKHAKAQDELRKSHDSEKKALQEEFERTRLLLQDQVDTLTFQNDSLKDKARRFEEALQRDSTETIQAALAPFQHIQEEMASLQAVLEMRAHTIHQQQNRILELEKLDETNVALKEKVRALTQQNEELKVRVNKNSAMTRQLSFEHSALQETLVKESKTNKRLSMENEELMWRLQNGEGLGSPSRGSPSSTSSSVSFRFPPSRSPASMSPSCSNASPALSPTHGGALHGTPSRVVVFPAPSPTHSLGTPVRSSSFVSPSRGHASPARLPASPPQTAAASPTRTPVSECTNDVPR